jgi:hypothetical protein
MSADFETLSFRLFANLLKLGTGLSNFGLPTTSTEDCQVWPQGPHEHWLSWLSALRGMGPMPDAICVFAL